jgi:hypothetical protein
VPVHPYEPGSWGPEQADELAGMGGWYAPRLPGQQNHHPADHA